MPKRKAGVRVIRSPPRELKRIQRILNELLSQLVSPRASAHGFIPGRDIFTNARGHVGKRLVLNLDLTNFFGTIHPGRVAGALQKFPVCLSKAAAWAVTELCTSNNELPQGAPTSPVLANLVAWPLDRDLELLARKYRCHYSRYADDITFSSNHRAIPTALFDELSNVAGNELTSCIENHGFKVNPEKTRLQRSPVARQTVTGLTVNTRMNVDRRFLREVRGALNALSKHGHNAQVRYESKYAKRHPAPQLDCHIHGQILFIGQARGRGDEVYRRLAAKLNQVAPNLPRLPVEPTLVQRMTANVWVIEGDESQGTGFWLQGIGLVTNEHVLEQNSVTFCISNPAKKHSVRVLHRDPHRDLAVLAIDDAPPEGLPRGNPARMQTLAKIHVIGFPDYAPGAEVSVKPATISSRKRRSSVNCFIIDSGISSGNSGGPVLNADEQVERSRFAAELKQQI